MIIPRITYIDGEGNATVDFVYPPTDKPADASEAQRTDVFSTAGVRQSTTLRVDQKFPINMGIILDDGYDLPQWKRFVAWAKQGGPFTYYPDRDNPQQSFGCFLVETDAGLPRVGVGKFSFTGTFQVEVDG